MNTNPHYVLRGAASYFILIAIIQTVLVDFSPMFWFFAVWAILIDLILTSIYKNEDLLILYGMVAALFYYPSRKNDSYLGAYINSYLSCMIGTEHENKKDTDKCENIIILLRNSRELEKKGNE